MKIYESVKTMLCEWCAARRERTEARLAKEVEAESQRRLQVREFKGGVFVCYDNIPLLEVCSLKRPLPEALDEMRTAFRAWRMENLRR